MSNFKDFICNIGQDCNFKLREIRSSLVKESINTLGKKGGFIPGPTNFLLDQPPENIVALYKAIQEFGSY